jgi:death-on-curing protein
MIEYLSVEDVLEIQRSIVDQIGGIHGVRDLGSLESAVSQPTASFGGEDLYSGVVEKAATLGFGLVSNHPFLDGNKRTGYVATRIFLKLNGYDLAGRTDDKQDAILSIASGKMNRSQFAHWIREHLYPRE